MPTKNELLMKIYDSKEIGEVIGRINPEHLRDDLKQHVFLQLLEKPDEFIIGLETGGKLKNYIVKMICQMVHFKKDKFYFVQGHDSKGNQREIYVDLQRLQVVTDNVHDNGYFSDPKYFLYHESFDAVNKPEEQAQHRAEDLCNEELEKVYWYNRDLLKLYVELGSYEAVAQEVGIPKKSVFNAVKKAKEQIKSKVLCQL